MIKRRREKLFQKIKRKKINLTELIQKKKLSRSQPTMAKIFPRKKTSLATKEGLEVLQSEAEKSESQKKTHFFDLNSIDYFIFIIQFCPF